MYTGTRHPSYRPRENAKRKERVFEEPGKRRIGHRGCRMMGREQWHVWTRVASEVKIGSLNQLDGRVEAHRAHEGRETRKRSDAIIATRQKREKVEKVRTSPLCYSPLSLMCESLSSGLFSLNSKNHGRDQCYNDLVSRKIDKPLHGIRRKLGPEADKKGGKGRYRKEGKAVYWWPTISTNAPARKKKTAKTIGRLLCSAVPE